MTFEQHEGITVLRDDLLPGGTKSIILPRIIKTTNTHKLQCNEYVYASPVYGGFQIALSLYCKKIGTTARIFCAKRAKRHENTIRCEELGAIITEVPYGYLSVIEKAAREYCEQTGATKIEFGAKTDENINTLSLYVEKVMATYSSLMGNEPDEIWCAVGSGMLVESILKGTKTAIVHGVCVGASYFNGHPRFKQHKHHLKFEQPSRILKIQSPFPSMPNYDLKAWEYCLQFSLSPQTANILFWNVL